MKNFHRDLLNELQIPETLKGLAERTIASEFASELTDEFLSEVPGSLSRWALLYELSALRILDELETTSDKNQIEKLNFEAKQEFLSAFQCWRALLSFKTIEKTISIRGLESISEDLELDTDVLTFLAFRLAATAVLSDRPALARLELEKFVFVDANEDLQVSWQHKVASAVYQSFVLLTRKGSGWKDVNDAIIKIGNLRTLQGKFEDQYLQSEVGGEKVSAAVGLVGYYHLAQMMTLTGEYLQTGRGGESATKTKLELHRDQVLAAFDASERQVYKQSVKLLSLGCAQLISSSIWSHSVDGIKDFINVLADKGSPTPILELWPAQQKALYENVLSTYHRAILVEMPTSAGKTLLAKFAMVQAKALSSGGTIAYVVPTRALVNQITSDLRSEFGALSPGWRVEQTVPAFELDPTEDKLLGSRPDVLVTTPEKLDLLLRREHSSLSNLIMVIADEAHNLADSNRGGRLELLLGMIKRDRPNVRFLLLSPFMPGNKVLLDWLGDGKALDAITVDWRPSNRVVGAIKLAGSSSNRRLIFETLPAADNADIRAGLRVPLGPSSLVDGNATIENLTTAAIRALENRGSVFVLCEGKGTATGRATHLAEHVGTDLSDPYMEAVCRFIETEAGSKIPLIDCLRRGVAYHHAGLSHETRWLIEKLAKRKLVSIICGTTTLAQGVNFPISTVIVESLRKGSVELTYADFWNIAGRAGRTLVDTVGIVGFPVYSAEGQRRYTSFLQGEAEEIASQLASVVQNFDEVAGSFNMAAVSANPGLSALLQFLAHAMKVAKNRNLADEVEEIMRSSLVYHQLKKSDKTAASKLVSICRRYLMDLGRRNNILHTLNLADQTGFATPSVFRILAEKQTDETIASVEEWMPEKLFGNDSSTLTKRIELLADLPEIQFGTNRSGKFRADLIAKAIRDWVHGCNLSTLANNYPHLAGNSSNDAEAITNFSQYLYGSLLGKASWGLGALESVYLGGLDNKERAQVGYVPSMVFYGVSRKEAVWLRMAGVPRTLADGLGKLWNDSSKLEPESYDGVRSWVTGLSDQEWRNAIPENSSLRPQDCRILWKELST